MLEAAPFSAICREGIGMMVKQLNEKQVLRKLGIPDFRHLTKEKAITLVNMLD